MDEIQCGSPSADVMRFSGHNAYNTIWYRATSKSSGANANSNCFRQEQNNSIRVRCKLFDTLSSLNSERQASSALPRKLKRTISVFKRLDQFNDISNLAMK